MQGVKRQRETTDEETTPHIVHLELISGLTRRRAETVETGRRAAHEQLASSNDISALLRRETSFLLDGNQAVYQALLPVSVLHGGRAVAAPTFVDTVQLVAEDGEVVVLKAQPSSDALRTVRVRRDVGEQLCAGDVVLFMPSISADTTLYEARLLTFDLRGAFSGADAATVWGEAAVSNMVAVVRWAGQLLAQPPGLAQLSYLLAARLASPHETGSLASASAWTRSLQLPLLLIGLDANTRTVLSPSLVRRLRQTIRALLRLYINLFSHAQALMPTATLFATLLYDFVASPLFVDGLPELAVLHDGDDDVMHPGTADERGNVLADALELVVEHVCRGQAARQHPWRTELVWRAQDALSGVELLLSRLARGWLAHRPRHDEAAMMSAAVLEVVVRRGSLLTVVQWLQEREQERIRAGSGDANTIKAVGAKATGCLDENDPMALMMAAPLLERLHLPPTLDDESQLCEDKSMSVSAQLAVMQSTYRPSLSRDATRFLDATILAAYVELYGPCLHCAAQLARRGTSAMATATAGGVASDVCAIDGTGIAEGCVVRLHSVVQPRAQRADTLARLSMSGLRHESEFGPAVKLHVALRAPRATGGAVDYLVRMLAAYTMHTECQDDQHGASVFGYVVVHLQEKAVAFPVILTDAHDDAGAVDVTAHVLRDADMLGDFVSLSAALETFDGDGLPRAWLVVACQTRTGSADDVDDATAALVPTRLLPPHTPALTYVDLIRRLLSVRATLARDQGSVLLGDRDTNTATRSLWMHYFGTGAVPRQPSQWLRALTPTTRHLQTGGGGEGEHGLQTAVRDVAAAAASLTHAQIEALHELCTPDARSIADAEDEATARTTAALTSSMPATAGSATAVMTATATSDGSSTSAAAASQLRLVEGVTGTGRTCVLYGAGLVRGRLHSVARKAQQADLSSALRESGAHVCELAQRAREASTLHDLFAVRGDFAHDDGIGGMDEAVARHTSHDVPTPKARSNTDAKDDADAEGALLDALVRAALAQTRLHTRLVCGLQHSTTPLLLRAGTAAVAQRHAPASVRRLFSASGSSADGESAARSTAELTSLAVLLREGYERSQRAPAVRQCAAMLDYLRSLGDAEARLMRATETDDSEDDGRGPLYVPLLSLLMSARDVHDSVTAAAASATAPAVPDAAPYATWSEFLRARVWPEDGLETVLPRRDEANDGNDDDGAAMTWPMLSPSVEMQGGAAQTAAATGFHTVAMPETMRLSRLRGAQARAWFVVFAEKQRALLLRLRAWLHRTRQAMLAYIYDITLGVTTTLQSTRYSLLTTTDAELMDGTCWPLLWRWRPATLLVDDVDLLGDVTLALLPAVSHSVTVSLAIAAPPSRVIGGGLAVSLLRELRKDLQRAGLACAAGALTTVVLRESLRCNRDEVRALLTRLARSPVGSAEARLLDGARGMTDAAAAAPKETTTTATHSAEKDGGADDETDGQELTTGLCGLASCSTVEMWTHAVPLQACLRADYRAARFLQAYWASYGAKRSVALFTSTAADSLALRATQSMEEEKIARSTVTSPWPTASPLLPLPIRLTPLTATLTMCGSAGEDGEGRCDDDEIDVALVSLSGLAVRLLRGRGGPSALPTTREARTRWWDELQRRNDHSLERRLACWLWRILSRVRYGVVLLGPSELCHELRVLRQTMHFVSQQRARRALSVTSLAYWLPPSDECCAALALECPSHYKCRRIAFLRSGYDRDGGSSGAVAAEEVDAHAVEETTLPQQAVEDDVAVRLRGATVCHSLCLQTYTGCERKAHACLHECHVMDHDANATTRHTLCPYPCGTVLPCGHVCHRACGELCAPCEFVGLQEMSCGQRVISGVSEAARQGDTTGGAKMAEYAFFAHFQTRPCGAAPRPCGERVSVMCPRCGARSLLACHIVTAHAERVRGAAPSAEPAAEDEFVLGDAVCPGCVQVYNTVAKRHGYATLAVPCAALEAASHDAVALTEDAEAALHATLPRAALSATALAELRQGFLLAGKKAQLLVMKEALEISSGRAATRSDFVVHKTRYEAQKAERTAQEASWRDGLGALVERWTQRLRGSVEVQVEVNAELETLLPLLRSEAEMEAQRQQAYVLV